MTLKGGTSQACAACKYQRRRCSSECPLAPYFPPDQPKMFQNAHKLFGVSNILKILKTLDSNQKAEAMRSIIYQSDIRDKSPVHGCLGVTQQLQYHIWLAEEELRAVHAQLEIYRQQQQQQHHQISNSLPEHHHHNHHHDVVPSQLDLGMAPPTNGLSLFNHTSNHGYSAASMAVSHQHSYSNNSSNVGYNSVYVDSKDNLSNPLWAQHQFSSLNNNNHNSMAIQSQMLGHFSQPLAAQPDVIQDYDEIHPFFDTIDDRQSYMDSKKAYESRYITCNTHIYVCVCVRMLILHLYICIIAYA